MMNKICIDITASRSPPNKLLHQTRHVTVSLVLPHNVPPLLPQPPTPYHLETTNYVQKERVAR